MRPRRTCIDSSHNGSSIKDFVRPVDLDGYVLCAQRAASCFTSLTLRGCPTRAPLVGRAWLSTMKTSFCPLIQAVDYWRRPWHCLRR